jgi:hypothetical protein
MHPHWALFQTIDEDLHEYPRYLEFQEDNFRPYSVNLARLYLSIGSEIDIVAKLFHILWCYTSFPFRARTPDSAWQAPYPAAGTRKDRYDSTEKVSEIVKICAQHEVPAAHRRWSWRRRLSCAEDGFIEITEQADGRIFAVVLPEGWALLDRLRAEQEKERAAQQAWIAGVIRDRPPALPKEGLTAACIMSLKPRRADEP